MFLFYAKIAKNLEVMGKYRIFHFTESVESDMLF